MGVVVGAEPWEQKHKEFFSSLPTRPGVPWKAGAQPLFLGRSALEKWATPTVKML
jgi:hypothetical protein